MTDTPTHAASRQDAVDAITRHYDDGTFIADLARRVAIRTESQLFEERTGEMLAYLGEMRATLEPMGYSVEVLDNPSPIGGPFLVARRHEGDDRPTVFTYGHGDVVRGFEDQWHEGLSPWTITPDGDKLYGRGTADNKGQHSINIAALRAVLETRGSLGFNSTILIETGEETGSPGLPDFARAHKDMLAADVLIGSDGPRLRAERPTLFMGTRGVTNFDLICDLREGGHHSGNWGGLISNPATIMANALASIVDERGQIKIEKLRPTTLTNSIRAALADCEVDGGENGPPIEPDWGEKSLTPAERVFAWNSFEVLGFLAGTPGKPVNAIPPKAVAHCQLRFVVGTDPESVPDIVQEHLIEHGFDKIVVKRAERSFMQATRLDPDHPWVQWAASSIAETTGKKPAILPNLGGSLPNDVFADILGLPTIWVPHSYASCSQHAPNEHALGSILREGLQLMTGLFWDLGAGTSPWHGKA